MKHPCPEQMHLIYKDNHGRSDIYGRAVLSRLHTKRAIRFTGSLSQFSRKIVRRSQLSLGKLYARKIECT